jgi:hypothetical protein
MFLFKSVFFFVVICSFSVSAFVDTTLTVIASGDAHGMVQACDCNLDPGGGLPKRGSFMATLGDRTNIIFVDAGGFSAGGLYDSYTEGRKADSIKTEQMIKGMGVLGYDAVGVGDDDLQYGGEWLLQKGRASKLPLVSANCFKSDGTPLFPAIIYLKKGPKTIAITSVTTTEKLFSIDKKIEVRDPLLSLKKIWKEMVAKSDYQIILSHLGSTKTSEISESFPECDLMVNGHRKNETNALSMATDVPVLQFGFQGKALSYVTLSQSLKKLTVEKNGWYTINDKLPDDSTVIAAINSLKSGKQASVYDLYMMSQCPYGLEALVGFVNFIEKSPEINWNIWFIGSVENDTLLSSLHGAEEVKDEMLWLAIKELYPARWFEFIKKRSEVSVPTELIIKGMGIPQADLNKWVEKNGVAQLSGHYLRSIRLNVKASPTLLINNVPYEKVITGERLLKHQCDKSTQKSPICDSLPQCFDNSDCKKKGKNGRCVDGKCVFIDAAPFTFSVLVADSTRQHPETAVTATTEDLFPGAIIEKIPVNSPTAAAIFKTYSPEALPFYLFSKDVKQAYNFDQVGSGLIEKNGALLFKKGITRNNYFYKRKLEKGKVLLFIDPFFKEISGIFTALQNDTLFQSKISIVPVIYSDPQGDLWGTEEGFRQEEALRWLIMGKYFPDKYSKYLQEYAKSPGSSYWFKILDKIGLPADSFVTVLRSNSDLLFSQWKQLLSLSVREPAVVLFDNRELAVAGNKKELEELLSIKK